MPPKLSHTTIDWGDTGHPVRSAIHKPQIGGLVVGWVTTSEYPLLYVFFLFLLPSCCRCQRKPCSLQVSVWLIFRLASERNRKLLAEKFGKGRRFFERSNQERNASATFVFGSINESSSRLLKSSISRASRSHDRLDQFPCHEIEIPMLNFQRHNKTVTARSQWLAACTPPLPRNPFPLESRRLTVFNFNARWKNNEYWVYIFYFIPFYDQRQSIQATPRQRYLSRPPSIHQ